MLLRPYERYMRDTVYDLSVCVFQHCQWLWWGTVCLPEPTDCPVYQKTEGHQQIPHEKVSSTLSGEISVVVYYPA